MRKRVIANYTAELSTAIDIEPGFPSEISPLAFRQAGFSATVTVGSATEAVMLPDGDHLSGAIQKLGVVIDGRGAVALSGNALELEAATDRAYETALVSAVSRFVGWVRLTTRQSWLDDRFPVRAYVSVFSLGDGTPVINPRIAPDQARVPRMFLDTISLSVDDLYSQLEGVRWKTIGQHLATGEQPPRIERLLADAEAFLHQRQTEWALLSAVVALELALAQFVGRSLLLRGVEQEEANLIIKKLSTERGVRALLDIAKVFDQDGRIDEGGVHCLLDERNAFVHGGTASVSRRDVRGLTRTVRRLATE